MFLVQCICKPFVILTLTVAQILGVFIQMLDCFLLYRFHSESGQYKRAKTVKVDISSSYLTPVLFKECDEIDKPILIFLQI